MKVSVFVFLNKSYYFCPEKRYLLVSGLIEDVKDNNHVGKLKYSLSLRSLPCYKVNLPYIENRFCFCFKDSARMRDRFSKWSIPCLNGATAKPCRISAGSLQASCHVGCWGNTMVRPEKATAHYRGYVFFFFF